MEATYQPGEVFALATAFLEAQDARRGGQDTAAAVLAPPFEAPQVRQGPAAIAEIHEEVAGVGNGIMQVRAATRFDLNKLPNPLASYDETSVVGGGGVAKITNWHSLVVGGGDLNFGEPYPVLDTLDELPSFGQIAPNTAASCAKTAGAHFPCQDLVVLAVFKPEYGTGTVRPPCDVSGVHPIVDANGRLSVSGDGVSPATTFSVRPAAGGCVLGILSTATGMYVYAYDGNVIADATTATIGTTDNDQFLRVGGNGGGTKFYGGVPAVHIAKSGGLWFPSSVQFAAQQLARQYGIKPARHICVLKGDSHLIGAKIFGGQSPAGYIFRQRGDVRVVQRAIGGETVEDVLASIADVYEADTLGTLPSNARKVCVFSFGANNAIFGPLADQATYRAHAQACIDAVAAHGFRSILQDVPPISNRNANNAIVHLYESNRTIIRAAHLQLTGVTLLRYCDDPGLAVPANDGTDAGVAAAVRSITQSPPYFIPAEDGSDPTSDWSIPDVGGYSDELHLGRKGWMGHVKGPLLSAVAAQLAG